MRQSENGKGDIQYSNQSGLQNINYSKVYESNDKASLQYQRINFGTEKLNKSGTNGIYQIKQPVWQSVAVSLLLFTLTVIGIRSELASYELYKQMQNISFQFSEIKYNMTSFNQNDQILNQTLLQVKQDQIQIQPLLIQMALTAAQLESLNQNYKDLNLKSQQVNEKILSLTENLSKTSTQIDHIQKEFTQIQSFQDKLIRATTQIESIQSDVQRISGQIQTDQLTLNSLSNRVSVLETDSSRISSEISSVQHLSPKIEIISVKIDDIKSNLNNVSALQSNLQQIIYSMPNNSTTNISSEISSIKSQITNLQSSINAGGFINTIEMHGPFVSASGTQTLNLVDSYFTYFSTTKSCFITTKGKAVITLISSGLGYCENCHGQITFLKDKILHLSSSGLNNRLNGSSFFYTDWQPINITQEFIVEEGTHEFVIGVNLANGGSSYARFVSLSFVAKVTYYS